jgi:hypothetical protein
MQDTVTMRTKDGLRAVHDGHFVESSRWEEAAQSVAVMSTTAPGTCAVLTSDGAVVGPFASAASAMGQLVPILPAASAAGANVVVAVADAVDQLRMLQVPAGKVAQLVLLVDAWPADGDRLAAALRPLEGAPVDVIVRVYGSTSGEDVAVRYRTLGLEVDVPIHVVGGLRDEAARAAQLNPWVPYSEHVHRIKELGLGVPALDALTTAKMSRGEIRAAVDLLLPLPAPFTSATATPSSSSSSSSAADWPGFLAAVAAALDHAPPVLCPTCPSPHLAAPWTLPPSCVTWTTRGATWCARTNHSCGRCVCSTSPSRPARRCALIPLHRPVPWQVYMCYATNAAAMRAPAAAAAGRYCEVASPRSPLQRQETRRLDEDACWQLLVDFQVRQLHVPFFPVLFSPLSARLSVGGLAAGAVCRQHGALRAGARGRASRPRYGRICLPIHRHPRRRGRGRRPRRRAAGQGQGQQQQQQHHRAARRHAPGRRGRRRQRRRHRCRRQRAVLPRVRASRRAGRGRRVPQAGGRRARGRAAVAHGALRQLRADACGGVDGLARVG